MKLRPTATLSRISGVGALVAGLLLVTAASAAGSAGALQGEYQLHGKTRVDPPPGEPQDTHLGMVLEGTAARDLYRRLKGRSIRDLCLDDGSRSKTQGPVRCTELANRQGWRCEFAIQIETLTIVADGAC